MSRSLYLYADEQWWWWSRWMGEWAWWEETEPVPSDGGRYPAVDIVILTDDSYDYGLARKPLTDPPPNGSPGSGSVISIKDMKEWQSYWDRAAPYKKLLLVYEFYNKNNPLVKAMDKPLEGLAKQYKGKAEFYKLDVDNFKFLARLCGVEGAYPTFALFKNCKQVGKVVGTKEDDLQRSIEQALALD